MLNPFHLLDGSILRNKENDSGSQSDAAKPQKRGDFTTKFSTLKLIPLTIIVGISGALVALVLVWMIGFITNLLYYQRIAFHLVSPAANTLGWVSILIPVGGGAIVGLMALYGSKQIRGHGIPEAIETILVGGSKVQPKLTVLKPISSAISIGTGGPFGAEGPIILTGGAVGSVLAQFLNLTAIERRCLLVAGAAAGMSAIFGTPIAAVLLGIELLIFEWKPRSLVLIGLASGVAAILRHWFVTLGWLQSIPLFPVSLRPMISTAGVSDALIVGVVSGLFAWIVTKAVYGAEDAFKKLPIHWAWWPAIGGLIIGIGGLIEPRALGVGYDTIALELTGALSAATLISLFAVKLVIWAIGLGSGTSGGILAPLLMMGAAIGGLLGMVLPGGTPADWAVLGMAGLLAGVTRSPFTSIIFALELTYNMELILPLLLTTIIANLISVLILKRSILTEKVARRGFHLLREYSVNPSKLIFVKEVMATDIVTLESGSTLKQAVSMLKEHSKKRFQRLIPVMKDDEMLGVVPWQDIIEKALDENRDTAIDGFMLHDVFTTYPDHTLDEVADRMAREEIGTMPVMNRDNPHKLEGLITQYSLLAAHSRNLHEEDYREQVLHIPYWSRFLAYLRYLHHTEERKEDPTLKHPDKKNEIS